MGINFNSKFRAGKLISMSQKFRYKDSKERHLVQEFSEFGIFSKNTRKNKEEVKKIVNYKVSNSR